MSYTPTTFNNGAAPGISAAELNKLGTQYSEAAADLAAHKGLLTTRGDIPFRGASDWERLAKGSAKMLLKQGANDPYWELPDYPRTIKYPGTRYVRPGWYAHGYVAAAPGASVLALYPIFVAEQMTAIRIGVYVTQAAGGTIRLGIWNWSNGLPGTLILDAGTVMADVNSFREVTINQVLEPGYYWVGYTCSGATVKVYAVDMSKPFRAPVSGFMTDTSLAATPRYVGVSKSGVDPANAFSDNPVPDGCLDASFMAVSLREN
jgi:hypothetical protein